MKSLLIFTHHKTNRLFFEDGAFYIWRQIVRSKPEQQFIFLLPENASKETLLLSSNIEVRYYPISRWLFMQRLYLQRASKDFEADHCILVDETPYIPFGIPLFRNVTSSLNNNYRRVLQSDKTIWWLSESPNDAWQAAFVSNGLAYHVLPPLMGLGFIEQQEADKIAFKQAYTEGQDYVLMSVIGKTEEEQWIRLLKAYTQFKQWNKTGLKLLIGCMPHHNAKLQKMLDSYKLRAEVKLYQVENEEAWSLAISASFMLVDMTCDDRFTASILRALQYGVPLVVRESTYLKQQLHDAVLYAKEETAVISSRMTLIYKDEAAYMERRAAYMELSTNGVGLDKLLFL